jgi:hypothetical protein
MRVLRKGGGRDKTEGGGGVFILSLYAEIYKELAAKQRVRMHEEFQSILDIWRSDDKQIQGGARKQILTIPEIREKQ